MPTSDRAWVAGAALLLLVACGDRSGQTNTQLLAKVEAEQARAAEDDGLILCARGEQALRRTCTVERSQEDRGLVLTVRHDDGGFHRLLVTRDGRSVVAADGAEQARVSIPDTPSTSGAPSIDVAIGSDRYRLPATIKR